MKIPQLSRRAERIVNWILVILFFILLIEFIGSRACAQPIVSTAAIVPVLYSSTAATALGTEKDACGNTDPKRMCLVWNYSAVRKDNATPFFPNQARWIYIIYEDQPPRQIPPTQTFLTAACVKGTYQIYIEDMGGNISDFSNKVFVNTAQVCLPAPLPPVIKCTS